MGNYKEIVLSNGAKLILINIPRSYSVTISAFIKAGFHSDPKELPGLAHFVEHMIFKGCDAYPSSLELAQAVEKHGGWHNAYTGIDYQQHTIHMPSDKLEEGVKVLLSSLSSPLFDESEIENEKNVLNEEILKNISNPERAIWDYAWQPLFFENTSLARPYSGTAEDVKKIEKKDLVSFVQKHFVPDSTVFLVAGDIQEKNIIEYFEAYGKNYIREGETQDLTINFTSQNQVKIYPLDIDQSTIFISIKTVPLKSNDRFILNLICDFLGGFYASKLPMELRDRHGLIYNWYTYQENLQETGYLYFMFSTGNNNIHKSIKIVLSEFQKLANGILSQDDFDIAKSHLIGSLKSNIQHGLDYINWYGPQALLSDHIFTIDEAVQKYNSIKIEEVKDLCIKYFNGDNIYIAIAGSANEKEIKALIENMKS